MSQGGPSFCRGFILANMSTAILTFNLHIVSSQCLCPDKYSEDRPRKYLMDFFTFPSRFSVGITFPTRLLVAYLDICEFPQDRHAHHTMGLSLVH